MEKLKVLIGRSSECDFTIANPEQHGTVSGKHATIYETTNPDLFTFEDHSMNGSFINGKYLHHGSYQIGLNDHITLGKTYVLPLEDIVKRYLSSGRVTQRKKRTENIPPIHSTPIVTIETPEKKTPENGERTPSPTHKADKSSNIPVWVWIVLVIAVFAAFVIGYFV